MSTEPDNSNTTPEHPQEAGQLHALPDIFGKCPIDLAHNMTVTDGAIRLYIHMHWRYGNAANTRGNWESRGSMAKFLGVSERTITSRIAELAAEDWIVVVDRMDENGAHLTCFYHIFENQSQCRTFRKTYICKPGEKMRDKPSSPQKRKSRKGVGGRPVAQKDEGGGTQVPGVKNSVDGDMGGELEFQGGVNLSSTNLDPYDLDPIKNKKKNPPYPPKGDGKNSASKKEMDNVSPKVNTFTRLIKAWEDMLPSKPLNNPYQNKTTRKEAEALEGRGIEPHHIQSYIRFLRQSEFWRGKLITFHYVAQNIGAWKADYYTEPFRVPDTTPPALKPTPDKVEDRSPMHVFTDADHKLLDDFFSGKLNEDNYRAKMKREQEKVLA